MKNLMLILAIVGFCMNLTAMQTESKNCSKSSSDSMECTVSAQNEHGNTALHYACERGDWNRALQLLDRSDIDVNVKGSGGTPIEVLYISAESGGGYAFGRFPGTIKTEADADSCFEVAKKILTHPSFDSKNIDSLSEILKRPLPPLSSVFVNGTDGYLRPLSVEEMKEKLRENKRINPKDRFYWNRAIEEHERRVLVDQFRCRLIDFLSENSNKQ